MRVYCNFGWSGPHDLTHPGHAFIRYKRDSLLWRLQYSRLAGNLFQLLNRLVVPYHKWLYRLFYRKAILMWPHLRLEILSGADYSELLREHGVHHVRTGPNSYEIHYDWHPDNYVRPEPPEEDVVTAEVPPDTTKH